MCPACVVSAVVAGGVASSGGITALVLRVFGGGKNRSTNEIERRTNDGTDNAQENTNGRATP